jgi:hypothetical protein
MKRIVFSATLLCATLTAQAAEPTPISAFARMPYMRNVTISPSGKQIAFITGNGDRNSAFTLSLDDPNRITPLVADSDDYHMQWCNWANDSRLLCSFFGVAKQGGAHYPVTRLVAINADGSNMKVLLQNTVAGGQRNSTTRSSTGRRTSRIRC